MTASSPSDATNRLAFIDVLRGVGALAVFAQHAGIMVSQDFTHFTERYFQLGQFGVMLFFLCSGFVIPLSLERHGSLTRFWVSRVFRLYPLYWFSLASMVAVAACRPGGLAAHFGPSPGLVIGANVTMLQTLFGVPNALGVYWSLAFEMGFYILASAFFAIGVSRYTYGITVLLLLGSILIGLFFPLMLQRSAPIGLLFNFATMYVGAVFLRFYAGTLGRRELAITLAVALVAIVSSLGVNFYGRDELQFHGTRSFLPMLTAWVGAYLVFGLSFFFRWRLFSGVLIYCGTVSYSIYLLHTLVLTVIPVFGNKLVVIAVWSAVLLTLASLTYYLIEEPCIALGRRFRPRPRRPDAPAVQTERVPAGTGSADRTCV